MYRILKLRDAWPLVLLIGMLTANLQGPTLAGESSKKVIFKKVQHKEYDAIIRDIAFDFVVKEGQERIYCKAIVLEDSKVQIFDENGREVFQRPLVHREYTEEDRFRGSIALLSKRGNYVAIHDYVGKVGDAMDYFVEEEYTIYNDKGEEIYKIKGPMQGTGALDRLLISDKDGSIIGTRLEYGALDFYDTTGETKTMPILGEVGWGKSTGGKVALSDNGEYLAVLVGGSAKRPQALRPLNTEVWVMLFDKSGNELWRRKVDQDRYGNIAISQKGEYVFFKAYSHIEKNPMELRRKGEQATLAGVTVGLYDKEGAGLSFEDPEFMSFGSFCFSPQADYVALGGGNLLRLTRTEDGSAVFEKELPKGVGIRRLSFSGDGQYLVVGGNVGIATEKVPERGGTRTVYATRVFVINMEGELVWQNDFVPRLRGMFSENGFLAFFSPRKYEIFKRIKEN
jgi:hypothetical protein